MADTIAGIVVIVVLCFLISLGYHAGADISRSKIINACIEANSDLPHNQVREFCNKRLEQVSEKRNP